MLWKQIQYLSLEEKKQIFEFYRKKNFPTEVRQHLAVWIENNIVPSKLSVGVAENEHAINLLCTEFIDEIARAAQVVQSDSDFLQSLKLNSAIEYFRTLAPLQLFQTIKECVAEEMRLVQNEMKPLADPSDPCFLAQKVCIIANQRLEFSARVDALIGKQAELRLKQEERQTKAMMHAQLVSESQMNGRVALGNQIALQIGNLDNIIASKMQEVYSCDLDCAQQAESVTNQLEELVEKIFEELMPMLKWSSWGLEDKVPTLDDIQRWYSDLIETILEFYNLILRAHKDSDVDFQSPLRNKSLELLQKLGTMHQMLMTNALVVEQQPNQVVKKETKFTASVRFLCGEKFIPKESPPEVKAVVINEEQAKRLYASRSLDSITLKGAQTPSGCGKVINDRGSKHTRTSCNRVMHLFNNMAIKEVKRLGRDKDKRANANRAMTEKFCLVFYTELKLYEQSHKIWCCSIPFVFIVHVNQKLEGWATIFWDNSFRINNRIPFDVPDEVPWSAMAVALNKFSQRMTDTKRHLTPTNLAFLFEKLFGHPDVGENFFVSRKKFSEKESTSVPTFWEWFYDILDLVNKHLKEYWDKGYIIGFMQRGRAEELLRSFGKDGAFLLRFSDSMLGAISLSYTFKRPNNEFQVLSVNPFNDAELKKLSLADRLSGNTYQYVYFHQMCDRRQEICWKSKSDAFPPRPRNCRRESGTVRLDYVPATVVMIINPNETLQVLPEVASPDRSRYDSESGVSEPSTPLSTVAVDHDLNLDDLCFDTVHDFVDWVENEEMMDYDTTKL